MARVPLNVRIPPELRARLIDLAAQENRPLSNLVETVLKRYAEQREPKPQDRRG